MIDWSVTANIIFFAVVCGLLLFTLISAIVVIAKGKRKCRAVDVLLRIVSALCFICSAVLFAAAVFTMLDGDICIRIAQPTVFVFYTTTVELPLPEVFALLSTTIGSNLIAVLLVTSLILLIADCLLANKKDKTAKAQADRKPDKKSNKSAKQTKTPEQIKREAELEKIRRLGNSAVKSASAAADSAKDPTYSVKADKNADKAAQSASDAAPPEDLSDKAENGDNNKEAVTDSVPDLKEQSDWRKQDTAQNTEFVGLHTETDPDFDTFDDLSDGGAEPDNAVDQTEEYDVDQQEETDEVLADTDEVFSDEDIAPSAADTVLSEDDTAQTDEIDDPFMTDLNTASDSESEDRELIEEPEIENEENTEQDAYDDIDAWAFEDGESGIIDGSEEQAEPAENADAVVGHERSADEYAYNADRADVEKPSGNGYYGDDKYSDEKYYAEAFDDRTVEPNRDIYIPKMRTIVVRKTDKNNAVQPRSTRSSRADTSDTSSAKKQTRSTSGAKRNSSADTAARRSAKSTNAKQKTAAPSKRAVRNTENERTPDGKKLPVTRRYVILDRTNAVNIFGNYLKERDNAEKNKLENSINTIILK